MPRTALIADDDPDSLSAVAASLVELGLRVRCAHDGAEFIQHLAETGPYDIVVTDIAMPWMSGVQAALSARRAGLTMPIVVMTALQDDKALSQVATLGENVALLRKPFGLAVLAATVTSMLSQATKDGSAA
jgi:DNA-binding response OmpR family regulator